jgi:iron complex outermembrane receptor protein
MAIRNSRRDCQQVIVFDRSRFTPLFGNVPRMPKAMQCLRSGLVALLVVGGNAAADNRAPSTLRMRTRATINAEKANQLTKRRPLRLAQPTTDEPAPADDAVPPDAVAAPANVVGAPAAEMPSTPAPDAATDTISDEELAKLAEVEAANEIIVVTGSTIDRREVTTPSPVTVLDKADLDGAGLATVGDVIQNLPANSNAINAQVNNGGDGSTRIDIRGLGAARTLVLLNGRRVVPGGTGADASVDVNSIPLAVIERVEVLKDGASAVYGSDAIGGVVNIITREDFEGTEVALYTGGAQRGDGISYDASFVTGHTSKNEKGNIIFSAGFQSQRPVFAGDRDFSSYDRDYDFMEADPAAREVIGGSSATPNGRINPSTIDYDGDGKPDGNGMLCGAGACKPDGRGGWMPFSAPDDLYNYQPENYLYTPSQRYNAFAKGHYKLNDSAKVFFEGLYINRQSDQQLAPEPFIAAVPISGDSIYNPLGADVFDYRRRLEEFGPRSAHQNIDTFRVVTGIGGKISDDAPAFKNWKWELSYNYGHTVAVQRNDGNLIKSRLAEALGPSFIDTDGTPRCGTPDAIIPGCVPMNIMGPSGSIDPAMRNYVTFVGVNSGYNDQKTALAQAGGRIVKLPADGDISLAVGADYRIESGGSTPDPLTATGDTTGNAFAPTEGKYNVAEAFGELSIVPVSQRELAEWVEISLAARGFRYNTFGSGATWKAGGLWKTIGGIGFRGTYSTAFRAPSVAELYQGKADSFPSASDPCDTDLDGDGVSDGPIADPVAARRCMEQGVPANAVYGTAQQRSVVGGNEQLQAETAKVFTAGIVIEPPVLKGLSLTVDYFRIKIKDSIQSLGAQIILANCYTRDQDDACAQVYRDPQLNGQIDYIDDPLSNVGGTNTDGIDFALALDHKTPAGRFRHQFEGQYLLKYELDNTIQLLQGVGYYDLGVYPRIKANYSTIWGLGGVNAGFNVRYVDRFKECMDNDCNTPENLEMYSRDVDMNITGDVFAGYSTKTGAGTTRFTVGVNNVTDQRPPLIYVGFAGDSDASTYDYMGRFFYMRMSQLF